VEINYKDPLGCLQNAHALLSKLKKKLKPRLPGSKHKPSRTGADTGGEGVDATGSLPRPEPRVVASGGHDRKRYSSSTNLQPTEPEPVPGDGSESDQEGGEAGVDGRECSQRSLMMIQFLSSFLVFQFSQRDPRVSGSIRQRRKNWGTACDCGVHSSCNLVRSRPLEFNLWFLGFMVSFRYILVRLRFLVLLGLFFDRKDARFKVLHGDVVANAFDEKGVEGHHWGDGTKKGSSHFRTHLELRFGSITVSLHPDEVIVSDRYVDRLRRGEHTCISREFLNQEYVYLRGSSCPQPSGDGRTRRP
jgi:hypothetical protein